MGRTARANLPGMPFHLTARVQGREPLFTGLEALIVDMLFDAVRNARMRTLAYAIMPNHLHLVVVQGPLPLAALMQPLLRRIALLISRRRGRDGHLFERRYRDHVCLDPSYLRNAIAYVHLNPVRAGLCRSPEAFPWTSHHTYSTFGTVLTPWHSAVELGLRLFADHDEGAARSWLPSYHRFLRWRQVLDSIRTRLDEGIGAGPERPATDAGDAIWDRTFGDQAARARMQIERRGAGLRRDLTEIARSVLHAENKPAELAWLRSGGRGPQLVRVRRQVISQSLTAGYTTSQIARFLRVSSSTVSVMAAARRAVST